jgi:hypothetical protein
MLDDTSAAVDETVTAEPVIKDCTFIASYDWLDDADATIIVPGTEGAPEVLDYH